MKTAKKVIGIISIASVIAFTLLAILGIWGIVDKDVALRAVSTVAVVFFASLMSLIIIGKVDK